MTTFNYESERKLPFYSPVKNRRYIEIACQAWFTSTGKIMPLMLKVKRYNDEILRLCTCGFGFLV